MIYVAVLLMIPMVITDLKYRKIYKGYVLWLIVAACIWSVIVQGYMLLATNEFPTMQVFSISDSNLGKELKSYNLNCLYSRLVPDLYDQIAAVFVGVVALVSSISCQRAIGPGDGAVILFLSCFLGIAEILLILEISFGLVWATGIVLRVIGKRVDRVPFIPYLYGAYITVVLWGGLI